MTPTPETPKDPFETLARTLAHFDARSEWERRIYNEAADAVNEGRSLRKRLEEWQGWVESHKAAIDVYAADNDALCKRLEAAEKALKQCREAAFLDAALRADWDACRKQENSEDD